MNEVITEIDNNILQNMKSLSYVKYKKKIFDKIRCQKGTNLPFKKIFSASIINPNLKNINQKLKFKSKLALKRNLINSDKKSNNNTMSIISKKMFMKKTAQSFYNKGLAKEETSTSLSSLIKTNTSFFNTSNFNFISERKKKLSMNNISDINNNNYDNNNRNRNNSGFTYFFNFSFDKYINDILNEDKYYQNDFSNFKFLESIRIMRKSKLRYYLVNKQINDLKDIQSEEINNYKQLEFQMKYRQKYFYTYNYCLRHYLQELANIKRKEQDHLAELKAKKENTKRAIAKLNIQIMDFKEKVVNLKEIKKFLFQVKFGNFIEQIPRHIKKEYGYPVEEEKVKDKGKEKEKDKEKDRKKNRSSTKLPKNIFTSDVFKQKMLSLFSKKKEVKKTSISIRNNQKGNKPLFDNPEQFMSCFNLKAEKIKENLNVYWKERTLANETKFSYEKKMLENESYMKAYLPEETKLLKNLAYQKKRNGILSDRFKDILETNRTEQNSLKRIAFKLKEIILNIETQINIKKFIKEKDLELFLSSSKDIYNNLEETIKVTKYILKIIEMITELFINKRNKIKKDKKMRELYRKVHVEIERVNNVNRYKQQVLLAAKRKEEKNRDVLNKIVKIRLGSVMKNGKKCYEEPIPERILLKRKLANRNVAKYWNKYEEEKDLFTYN